MRRFRAGLWAAALAAAVGAALAAVSARAQEPQEAGQNCPGNPNALGTSRVLAIDPAEYPRIGRMQYPDSLPLADKEVVITFDDGPLPPYSNQILDILGSQCVKVTYFLVGSMARAYPAVVRRMFLEGHTIGTHSEDHPFHFGELPIDKMRHEIDRGIADVSAALGVPSGVAPFFRIPGLDRSDVLESELAARSLVVFSSDTVADDWHHHIKPNQIVSLALSRLEARGKGILLLHDIHPTTVAALPELLKELKDKGFHVVQVVPATLDHIDIAGKPNSWMLASAMPEQLLIDDGEDTAARPLWPQLNDTVTADDVALPAPDAFAFEPDAVLADHSSEITWPDQPAVKTASSSSELPARGVKRIATPMGRRNLDVTGSADHDRLRPDRPHAHRHARTRPDADGHHADLMSQIRAFAAAFSPAQPAH